MNGNEEPRSSTRPVEDDGEQKLSETTSPSRIGAGGEFGETETEREALRQAANSSDPTMGQPSAEELENPTPKRGGGTPQDNQGAARGM
jgi:hypothetical protein